MAALPYIQLYVADYLADTAHLTAAQNGAYLLLIFNYWQRGKPLDNRNERLANVARMSSDEWEKNKDVISEFFVVEGDTWTHARIDADLANVLSKSSKNSNAGKASAEKKKQLKNERSTNVEQTINHTDTDTDTDTECKNISDAKASSAAKREPSSAKRFSDFWSAWPCSDRKTAKSKCEKKWRDMKLDAVADVVLSHVEASKQSRNWIEGFEPSPLRYLSERRWEDGEVLVARYEQSEIEVFERYNATLAAADWPTASHEVYSPDRAAGIRQFMSFGQRENWMQAYFDWMRDNLEPRPGYGFDWIISRETFLRAREGNFSSMGVGQ